MATKTADFRLLLTSRVTAHNNRPCEFTTHLPETISLEGSEWEVGIESLHYLQSWYEIY